MITISKADWEKVPSDYKGIWHDYHGEKPEWLGRKVVMSTCITHNPNEICSLLVEGVHFIIQDEKGKH